jgi:hypothetical protein
VIRNAIKIVEELNPSDFSTIKGLLTIQQKLRQEEYSTMKQLTLDEFLKK